MGLGDINVALGSGYVRVGMWKSCVDEGSLGSVLESDLSEEWGAVVSGLGGKDLPGF